MKRVYTFDGRPAQRNLTLDCFRANKAAGTKMVQVDAGTTAQAALLAECEIDVIATGARETAAVRAGAPTTHITSALTVESFVTPDETLGMAIDCLCAGADSIYTARGLSTVERLAHEGICAQGHLGLVPRLSMRSGGLRAFGKTADEAMQLFADFKRLEMPAPSWPTLNASPLSPCADHPLTSLSPFLSDPGAVATSISVP
jgi:Ketopantoate hydroxymethyltransferase